VCCPRGERDMCAVHVASMTCALASAPCALVSATCVLASATCAHGERDVHVANATCARVHREGAGGT
jgi:hypothetical protein